MKKLILILLTIVSLTILSGCQKEEVKEYVASDILNKDAMVDIFSKFDINTIIGEGQISLESGGNSYSFLGIKDRDFFSGTVETIDAAGTKTFNDIFHANKSTYTKMAEADKNGKLWAKSDMQIFNQILNFQNLNLYNPFSKPEIYDSKVNVLGENTFEVIYTSNEKAEQFLNGTSTIIIKAAPDRGEIVGTLSSVVYESSTGFERNGLKNIKINLNINNNLKISSPKGL